MKFRALSGGSHPPRTDATILLEDCTALLSGRLLDELYESGRTVPSWAWVNKLAHSSASDLEAFASNPGTPEQRPDLWIWRRTSSYLARQLLRNSHQSDQELQEFQRSVLVPIELSAMHRPVSPSTLLRLILSALTEQSAH